MDILLFSMNKAVCIFFVYCVFLIVYTLLHFISVSKDWWTYPEEIDIRFSLGHSKEITRYSYELCSSDNAPTSQARGLLLD